MIANAMTVPLGLWLAFSALFPPPIGGTNDVKLIAIGVATAVLALLSRGTHSMAWQRKLNIALGAALCLFAGARVYFGDGSVSAFWIVLLTGIAVAIAALWSLLYRAESAAIAGPA